MASLLSRLRSFFMPPFLPITGRVTSYGYPGDSTPDSNSFAAIGAWDNPLVTGHSLAVSRDIETIFRSSGIVPRSELDLQLEGGTVIRVAWDDRTAKEYAGLPLVDRFDIFSATRPSVLVDAKVVGFRKV